MLSDEYMSIDESSDEEFVEKHVSSTDYISNKDATKSDEEDTSVN